MEYPGLMIDLHGYAVVFKTFRVGTKTKTVGFFLLHTPLRGIVLVFDDDKITVGFCVLFTINSFRRGRLKKRHDISVLTSYCAVRRTS